MHDIAGLGSYKLISCPLAMELSQYYLTLMKRRASLSNTPRLPAQINFENALILPQESPEKIDYKGLRPSSMAHNSISEDCFEVVI